MTFKMDIKKVLQGDFDVDFDLGMDEAAGSGSKVAFRKCTIVL